jgi:hypothetical protein
VIAARLPSRHTEQVHLDDAELTARAVSLPSKNMLTISIEPVLEGIAGARPTVHVSPLRVRQRQRTQPDDPDLRHRPGGRRAGHRH